MAYTPGVARVCEAIAAQPRKAWQLTIKGNSVAVYLRVAKRGEKREEFLYCVGG